MAVKEKIRIRLKSYDHALIDQASEKIIAQSVPAPVFRVPCRFRPRSRSSPFSAQSTSIRTAVSSLKAEPTRGLSTSSDPQTRLLRL